MQITVNQIQFDLTDVVGVSASDIQNLEIRYDVNNDGLIGVGETAKIADSGTVGNLITLTYLGYKPGYYLELTGITGNIANVTASTIVKVGA